jgi:hypothetical protein
MDAVISGWNSQLDIDQKDHDQKELEQKSLEQKVQS